MTLTTASQPVSKPRPPFLPPVHICASALQLKMRCLGVRANWTWTMSKINLGAFVFITSLPPTERLSQEDFTLGRDGLPLATQPSGATPNGTSGLLSTWFCSHGPHTSLLPIPITHLSHTFPVPFLCVYAYTCVCMFTRGRIRGTCASLLYACVRRPKVAVSGNFFSSFPFYSFDHFSTLLFWGRAFFFIYLFYTPAAAFPHNLPSQSLLPLSLFPQCPPFSSPTI